MVGALLHGYPCCCCCCCYALFIFVPLKFCKWSVRNFLQAGSQSPTSDSGGSVVLRVIVTPSLPVVASAVVTCSVNNSAEVRPGIPTLTHSLHQHHLQRHAASEYHACSGARARAVRPLVSFSGVICHRGRCSLHLDGSHRAPPLYPPLSPWIWTCRARRSLHGST